MLWVLWDLRGKGVVCQKRKKRPHRQADITKQSIFPPHVPSQNSGGVGYRIQCCCGIAKRGSVRGKGCLERKTGIGFVTFVSWDSLRGHGAVASSAVEVLGLGRDGGPAIVLHGLGCCLGLLLGLVGLSP
jgi:hypothetical protein